MTPHQMPGHTESRPFVVRPMTLDDVEPACHLYLACGHAAPPATPDPNLWWQRLLTDAAVSGVAVVLERNGRIVGALACPLSDTRPDVVELNPSASMWGETGHQALREYARRCAVDAGYELMRRKERVVVEYEPA